MSTTATVPVFDPQGILRDVPQDQLQTAVKAGGMPSVRFKAPNGDIRLVPANRTQEAVKAGGQLLPLEQQDVQHPGLWQSLADDLRSLPGKLYESLTGPDPLADPRVSAEEKNRIVNQQQAAASALNSARKQQHGTAYSLAASAGEMAGLNVAGAEKSAEEGDVGGVAGHLASTPVAMALTEGALRAAPVAAEAAAPAIRTAVKTGNKVLPRVVGAGVGGAVGAATHIPFATPTLAAMGAQVGPELLPKWLRIPGEGFGLPNRVTGGPTAAPSYAESLGPVSGGPAAAPSYAESLGPVQGGPANAPSYAESLGPRVKGGPRKAPSYEQFSGQLSEMNKPAVADMSTIESRLRSIEKKLQNEKAPISEEEDLTAKVQQSREAVIDQRVLGVLKKQGEGLTVSMQELGKDPALTRFTPEELQASAMRLRNAGKVWGHTARAGGEATESIYGIASR